MSRGPFARFAAAAPGASAVASALPYPNPNATAWGPSAPQPPQQQQHLGGGGSAALAPGALSAALHASPDLSPKQGFAGDGGRLPALHGATSPRSSVDGLTPGGGHAFPPQASTVCLARRGWRRGPRNRSAGLTTCRSGSRLVLCWAQRVKVWLFLNCAGQVKGAT